MIKKLSICCSALVLASQVLMAVPAKRGITQHTLPDGTTISVQRFGDEHAHTYLTADGLPIVKGADGYFRYATVADGLVKATDVIARDAALRTTAERTFVMKLAGADDVLNARRQAKVSRRAAGSNQSSGIGLYDDTFPHVGDVNTIIILAQYSDVKFSMSDPVGYYYDFLNKEGFSQNGGTGSARDYFLKSSDGKFRPVFDVYGPVTLPQKRAYYGGNDSSGDDQALDEMITTACRLADGEIDYAKYDLNGDGYVDDVYVIYAGEGEADSEIEDAIWPQQYELSAWKSTITLDGKIINTFGCCNEVDGDGSVGGVGTFCHEFGHVLGLPDLYSTSYNSAAKLTPGEWSIMDYGSYLNDGRTPPSYSIFERNAMGWIDPIDLTATPMKVSLGNIHDTNEGAIVLTSSPNEFFLFENRQKTGWDKYLPGHGMIVWHIMYDSYQWIYNTLNNSTSRQYVDIEEAGGSANNNSSTTMASYPFPGTKGVTSFTHTTKPSMSTWGGADLQTPITEITEKGGIISFNVCGGPNGAMAAPVVLPASEVSLSSFTANWQAVENATDYLLTVKYVESGAGEETQKCDFGTSSITLPAGWTSSTTDKYTGAGYCVQAPSLKLASDGKYVMTKKYDNDITNVKFWMRSTSTDNGNYMIVEGFNAAGQSTELLNQPVGPADKGDYVEISNVAAGIRQIRISFEKNVSGNLAVDDVEITTGGDIEVALAGYNGVSTGGATSMKVTGIPEGKTNLLYSVVACAEDGAKSPASKSMSVDLSNSGILDMAAPEAITLDGRVLHISAAAGSRVEVSDAVGRVLYSGEVPATGCLDVELAAGVALVRVGGTAAKYFVQ